MGMFRDAGRDDHLVLGDDDLCVVGLKKDAIAHHDATVRVREVALGFVRRLRIRGACNAVERKLAGPLAIIVVVLAR